MSSISRDKTETLQHVKPCIPKDNDYRRKTPSELGLKTLHPIRVTLDEKKDKDDDCCQDVNLCVDIDDLQKRKNLKKNLICDGENFVAKEYKQKLDSEGNIV